MAKLYNKRVNITELCKWLDLPKSVFYYQPREGKPGAKSSTHTLKTDGTKVSNEVVLDAIRASLNREFCCYGYHNITSDLRDMHYIINPKKVYRLMYENNLLFGKAIRTTGKREFVKFRKIKARYPMEYICMDIKYIWVDAEKRNYFLLTILDVFSRKVIEQIFQPSIRKSDVIRLLRKINLKYGIKGVTIRNDNGSQFIANEVRKFLLSAEAKQEFTHIATPEENAYIEAFHSIVQREVVDRLEFAGYFEAKQTFQLHLQWYNNVRKHGELGRITPQQKWDGYKKEKLIEILNFVLSGKAEAGNAGEQPARNNLTDGDNLEGAVSKAPSTPVCLEKNGVSLSHMPLKTQTPKEENDLNSFGKNVQTIGG